MTATELADTLLTIANQATVLRDAGVIGRITVGDISFEIAEMLEPTGTKPVETAVPAFDDPDSYPGGYIPQRRVRNEEPSPDPTEDDDD